MISFTVMTEISIIISPISAYFYTGSVIDSKLYFLILTPVLLCLFAVEIISLIITGFAEMDVIKKQNQPGYSPDWFCFCYFELVQ